MSDYFKKTPSCPTGVLVNGPLIPNESEEDEEEMVNSDDDEQEENQEEMMESEPADEDTGRTPRRRMNYTLKFKMSVVKYAEKNNNCKAATKFEVPRQCVQRWRKHKEDIAYQTGNTRRTTLKKRLSGGGRRVKYVSVQKELEKWLQVKLVRGATEISGKMVRDQAKLISGNGGFKASNGWLQKFMLRHGLSTPPVPK